MDKIFGIDELRMARNLFADCNEAFNRRFTVDELMAIYRAFKASGWDIYPDCWTDRQVKRALRGIPPAWDFKGRHPIYLNAMQLKAAARLERARQKERPLYDR